MSDEDIPLMQIIRITIDGVMYEMYAPVISQGPRPMGQIEELEFGEVVEMRYAIASLINHLVHYTSSYHKMIH